MTVPFIHYIYIYYVILYYSILYIYVYIIYIYIYIIYIYIIYFYIHIHYKKSAGSLSDVVQVFGSPWARPSEVVPGILRPRLYANPFKGLGCRV